MHLQVLWVYTSKITSGMTQVGNSISNIDKEVDKLAKEISKQYKHDISDAYKRAIDGRNDMKLLNDELKKLQYGLSNYK
ncbi:hypothetical protein JQC92_00555 [Shewanella sp. 202IG2-18]|uniref:hypothetical protein n=1 Tax=Parashewanella hymeniacidonis TaxID=2807618 RepID=UPI00195F6294|nr:hypothetical protein [Parashewanella hymeniacidonis]MBM7070536.1 hypothetical protein [Parashewanella hymeniacidonis]